MIRRRLAALIDLNKHVGVIRHILCINTRILRAEIQLQARSIELEGRIAADCRCSCHRSLAVRAVFTVGRIKTVAVGRLAIGFLCLLVAKLHANRIPSPGIIGKALFIVNRSSRDKADTQHLLRISRVADCNIGVASVVRTSVGVYTNSFMLSSYVSVPFVTVLTVAVQFSFRTKSLSLKRTGRPKSRT